MPGSIFSTLSGKLVGKHPELGVLVREDGKILCPNKGYGRDNPNAKFHWTVGYLDSMGYRFILIKKKYYRIHRLVAETFIPNLENKNTVDHINRNRSDNRISNLRWADMQEQSRNTKSYDAALDLGVRRHDDLKEWRRGYMRKYRARKKAEQSAQPSV